LAPSIAASCGDADAESVTAVIEDSGDGSVPFEL
jgi:hypothetical protein